ncbi:MAG: hypothetical protein IKT71_06430 [Paludibacteraceae bacterium]|nr:hypothetical protein [Paludibacteraceae bacterium]
MRDFLRYLYVVAAMLMVVVGDVWAGKAKVNAKSDPEEGGYVYVAKSAGSYSPNSSTDDATQDGDFWSKKDKDFYLYYKVSDSKYYFKGWYRTDVNWLSQWNSCDANSTTLTTNGQKVTHKADGGATTADYYYYAIFATLHNTTSPSFSTINVDKTTTATVTLKHAHANNVTLSITGDCASDFSINTNSFYSNQLGTQTITITFNPNCAGTRTANLKITNDNGLPEVNIPLSAVANVLPQTIAWDSQYDENMNVGGTLVVSATASTGQSVTYASSDPSVISVSGNTLTALKEGVATITASQIDGCTYETVHTQLEFKVYNKKTPVFWLMGDPNMESDNLKVEDSRWIKVENVDGMRAVYDPNLFSYSFDGDRVVVTALDAGVATLELIQDPTDAIFGKSRTFTFNITKYTTNTISNDLAIQYMVDDVIPEIDIYTINNMEVPVQVISGDENILKFENGQLKAVGAGITTVTVLQAETNKWVGISASKTIEVIKHTPEFTWNLPVYYNREVADFFSTTGSNALTYSSSDEDVATLSIGSNAQKLNLTTYNKEASTTLTVTQAENYYWYGKTETKVVTPIDPNNHVPFVMNSLSRREALFYQKETSNGEITCSEGGEIALNQNSVIVWTANPLYYTIEFSGIPHELSFDYKMTATATAIGSTGKAFIVYESADGNTWNEIWTTDGMPSNTNYKPIDAPILLNPKTCFLKFFYDGTYTGYYSNVTVTELDQFAAIDAEENEVTAIDFGDEVHVDASQTRYFDFKYANAGYKVKFEVISDTPDNTAKAKKYITFSHKDFVTIDGEKYLTSIGGEQLGTINDIAVQLYSETDEYSIPANTKIKISDEIGHEYYITLSGEIVKADQILMWQGLFLKDPVMLPLTTGTFSNVAKSSNDDLPITYESSNLEVITISNDGKTLTPIAEGEVVITAKQEGNHIYNPATPITRSVVVTGKKVQVIIWESSLSDLQVGDEPVTLTAKAYWIDMENDAQLVYSEEQTSKIQFTSNDPSIVSIEGNVLTIHAAGSTTVKAFVPGNDTYKEDQQVIPVRVRPTIVGCEDVLLLDHPDEFEFFKFDLSTPEVISPTYEIDHTKGVPGTLEFQHTGKPWTLGIEYYGGSILAQQSVDGNNWTEVTTVTPTKNATNISEGSVLDRKAKYIRFVRPQGGVGYHYVSNVKVYPANYIETSIQEKDLGTIQFGSQNEFSFEVAYSNIKYQISPKANESDVIITPISFGSCGAFGTQTITGTWTPNEGGDNITRTIVLTDINTGMSASVILKANVLKKDQYIKWNDVPTSIDDYTDIDSRPRKTLNASDEEVRDITYEIVNGTNLAAFDNGMFYLKGTGDIRIRAYHNGDAEYKPVEQFYNIHIASIQPTFLGTKNQDWTIHENWVNGIQPNGSDDFVVILAPTSISGMQINVKGLQIADNGAITVTSTGGMTVGEKGVSSAKNESRISIDNTPEGAGFFRIHPVAVTNGDTPATVTVNYTTKAKSGDPRDEIWQYVGAPGNNMQMSNDGILVYHWKEQKGWLLADTKMQPFVGYALTRTTEGSNNYEIHAEPVYTDQVIQLTKTASGMNGDNLFANSYLAPIDVRKIDKDDIIDPDNKLTRTFFLFNSGSWNDWKQGAGDITAAGYDHSSAGHYYSIPFYSAKLIDDGTSQVVIPPMQGVYVYSEGEAMIKFNYAKHVYGADASDLNKPMRMPQEKTWSDSFRRVRIQATSKNSGADRMYIVQEENTTSKYDNGYDGDNILAAKQVNIYTNEPFGQMEVSCSNNIDSMFIGFTAGEDSEYTLTFGAVVGKDMYLKDIEKNESILITDGGQYIFYAQPNSVNDMRFQLLLDPHLSNDNLDDDGVTTGGDNICSDITRVWINDKKLYVADVPKNTKLAVYTASGVCIATPYIIHHTPYTLDLSYLPTGVYVLRLNNQAYKFVCE